MAEAFYSQPRRREERTAAKLGAEVVVADMYDPEQLLQAAKKGTQRAYYLPLMRPYMIQAATASRTPPQGEARSDCPDEPVDVQRLTSDRDDPADLARRPPVLDDPRRGA